MFLRAIASIVAAALVAGACGADSETNRAGPGTSSTSEPAAQTDPPPATLVVTSSAYAEGERIPVEFTCDGEGTQPPYTLSGLPAATISIAVVMEATVPQGVFTHWVQLDLPPDPEIPSDAADLGTLGSGLFQALGYTAPCPSGDAVGQYTLQVFAVDSFLDLNEGVSKAKLLAALEGRVIGFGELTGEYSRA